MLPLICHSLSPFLVGPVMFGESHFIRRFFGVGKGRTFGLMILEKSLKVNIWCTRGSQNSAHNQQWTASSLLAWGLPVHICEADLFDGSIQMKVRLCRNMVGRYATAALIPRVNQRVVSHKYNNQLFAYLEKGLTCSYVRRPSNIQHQ
jgi:hypothetical protein